MDPQQEALRVPLGEDARLEEPRGSSILMDFTRNVVVWRRIRRSEPTSGLPLQTITCV